MKYVKTRSLLLGSVAVACVLSSPVLASDADLMKRIDSLENEVRMLRQSQQQTQKAVAEESIKATEASAQAVAATKAAEDAKKSLVGDIPRSIKIPGTNTSLRVGGTIKLDVATDINHSLGGSVADYSYITGSPASRRGQETQLTARATKLIVETSTPSELFGPIKTYIETDFYGGAISTTGPDRKNTNSGNFRIRHAYIDTENVRMGQWWSTFMDLPSSPETLDTGGPPGANNGIRQPMIRYQKMVGPGRLSAALESSAADFNGVNQTVFLVGLSSPSNNSMDKAPDAVVKYEYLPSWGSLTAAAVGRWQTYDPARDAAVYTAASGNQYKAGAWGGGLLGGGMIRPIDGKKSGFQFQVLGGPGIGRYIGPTTSTVAELGAFPNNVTKKLLNIFAWGAGAGGKVYWTDQFRSTFWYGHDHVGGAGGALNNLSVAGGVRPIKDIDAIVANILWAPFENPASYLGLEYTHAYVQNYRYTSLQAPLTSIAGYQNSGHADRLQFSVQYAF